MWVAVKNFPNYEVSEVGEVRNVHTGRVLTALLRQTKVPYSYVNLYRNGLMKSKMIHRLVAEAFIPNPEDLPLVLHGPAGVGDNSTENLRWGTNSDNMKDRVRDGTCFNSNKTHCPQGHEYTEDNIYRWKNTRKCKACTSFQRKARRRAKNRVAKKSRKTNRKK